MAAGGCPRWPLARRRTFTRVSSTGETEVLLVPKTSDFKGSFTDYIRCNSKVLIVFW